MKTVYRLSTLFLLIISSCKSDAPAPAKVYKAYKLSKLSGDGQAGYTSLELSAPVIVQLKDADGLPVPNIAIECSVISGGGSILQSSQVSDPAGKASFRWIMGNDGGVQKISVNAKQGIDLIYKSDAIEFSATASVTEKATAVKISPDGLEGFPGGQLFQPIALRVTDSQGNPLNGTVVNFTVTEGGGTFSRSDTISASTSKSTNAAGEVSLLWNLGNNQNAQKVTATPVSRNGKPVIASPVEFTATSNPAFLAGKWYYKSYILYINPFLPGSTTDIKEFDFGGGYLLLTPDGNGISVNKSAAANVTYSTSNSGHGYPPNPYPNQIAIRVDRASPGYASNEFVNYGWYISSCTSTEMTLQYKLLSHNTYIRELKLTK